MERREDRVREKTKKVEKTICRGGPKRNKETLSHEQVTQESHKYIS